MTGDGTHTICRGWLEEQGGLDAGDGGEGEVFDRFDITEIAGAQGEALAEKI